MVQNVLFICLIYVFVWRGKKRNWWFSYIFQNEIYLLKFADFIREINIPNGEWFWIILQFFQMRFVSSVYSLDFNSIISNEIFFLCLLTCISTQFLQMRFFSVYLLVFELISFKWDYFLVYLLVFELNSFKWYFFLFSHFNIEIFACTLMIWDLYLSSVVRLLSILWNKTRLCVLQILFHFYVGFKMSGLILSCLKRQNTVNYFCFSIDIDESHRMWNMCRWRFSNNDTCHLTLC